MVTASLMLACAVTSYIHHLYLIPKYWRTERYIMHAALLVTTMLVLTAIALAVIKVSYLYVFGPYPVNHWYIDYAIDFFGIAVHVLLAMAAVAVFRRFVSVP